MNASAPVRAQPYVDQNSNRAATINRARRQVRHCVEKITSTASEVPNRLRKVWHLGL